MPNTVAHATNIALHVASGIAALGIGFRILARPKGTAAHRRLGLRFCYASIALCAFAFIGLTVFRFIPLFTVLLILAAYQFLSGWRIIYTKEGGPQPVDGLFTGATIVLTAALSPLLLRDGSVAVIATLASLAAVLAYDAVKWRFPRRWYVTLWQYEHTYKMVAALYGMVAAFVGSVLRVGQPWLQHVATAFGQLSIVYFFWRIAQRNGMQSRTAEADTWPRRT